MLASVPTVPVSSSSSASLHADFEDRILPAVQKYARQRFAKDRDKEEKTQAAIALAWQSYCDLIAKDKQAQMFPSKLADFACRQVNDGRNVGGHTNSTDVLSPRAQQTKEFTVTGFSGDYDLPAELHEALGDHDRSPVPDQAAFRIDFPTWLATLSSKSRAVTEKLMQGHSTSKVAKMVGISSGRVSQLRRELMESWASFHGEPAPAA